MRARRFWEEGRENKTETWTGTYLASSSISGRFQSYSNLKLTKYILSVLFDSIRFDGDCNKYKRVSVCVIPYCIMWLIDRLIVCSTLIVRQRERDRDMSDDRIRRSIECRSEGSVKGIELRFKGRYRRKEEKKERLSQH